MLPTTIELSSKSMVVFEEEEQVMLMEKIVDGTDQLGVIAIVGIPGLGKTTLAKKFYHHENIVNRFDVRSWCTFVSQVYDKKRILLELLGYAFECHVEIERSENELIQQVQRCLEKRRYLVVIDDVWSTAICDELMNIFPDDNNRSRIIVTTRLDELPTSSVNIMFCYTYPLSFLAEDKSWLLLRNTVFKEESSCCPQELEEIGKQIAKSCAGLPLAIVLIGGLLARLDKKRGYWTKVAQRLSESAKVAGEAEWYMDIIELSYKHLPSYLKPCFLYFGMFLEDEEVSVKKLIRAWVAEGFVQSNEVRIAEIVAMDYLVDLITSNLVMVARRSPLGDIKAVHLHDLVLDFCLNKAKEENFLLKVDRSHGSDPATSESPSDLQRFVVCSKMQQFIKWLHPIQRIHTLRLYAQNINEFYHLSDGEMNNFIPSGAFSLDLFKSSLTVLDLENISIDASALEYLTSLIHLRYLSIFGSFSEIPPAISNLTNLETLAARPKSGTLTLPGSIWDMINLKHVDTSEAMIHFNNVEAEKRDVFKLEKLESFLKIVLVNGDDISEMCNRAPNLVQIELVTVDQWDNLFSSLKCLIYLETLAIYHSGYFPMSGISMIFPQCLRELTLSSCRFSWNEISTIGTLHNLEVLNILLLAFTGRKWTVGVGGFLNLRLLKIEHNSIKHWNMSVDSFPCLEQLVLRWCDNLEEIPASFGSMPSLQKIEARSCCSSARKSAVKIRNMQRDDMKNSDFKVIISLD